MTLADPVDDAVPPIDHPTASATSRRRYAPDEA